MPFKSDAEFFATPGRILQTPPSPLAWYVTPSTAVVYRELAAARPAHPFLRGVVEDRSTDSKITLADDEQIAWAEKQRGDGEHDDHLLCRLLDGISSQ